MNDCQEITAQLTAYVDGLLEPEAQAHVDRHLGGCRGCRELAASERGGHAALRGRAAQLLAGPLPPGLRSRCEALAAAGHAAPTPTGPWWRLRLVPVLLIAVLLVFSASTVLSLATRRSDTLLAAQLTADHAKCFRWLGPLDGTQGDASAVHRMLVEEYGEDVYIPPSSPADGVELLGARHCLYGDGVIPHVMYRVHGEDVSLFVLGGAQREAASLVTLGYRSQIWGRDATTFVLVSRDGAAGMAQAARYVMQEAH